MIKCKYKKVETIRKHYGNDWNNLILDGVDFERMNLSEIILPKDTELFQRIKDKSLAYTELPEGDYSKHNFDNVAISGAKFSPNSVFSDDIDVFQKITKKSLFITMLPKGDYRLYNFKGVMLRDTWLTKDTLLPEYENFLVDIGYSNSFILTDNAIRNIHNYNLYGVKIDLCEERYTEILTPNQLDIIKIRYPNEVSRYIKLPDNVCSKEIANKYDI